MANYNKETGLYEPGVIYELRYFENNQWTPFYVGESYKPDDRLKSHQGAGRNATDESTIVYNTIKHFNDAGIVWNMFTVEHYGIDGPTDREDEHIMKLLLQGITLTNEKKGNANWFNNMQAEAKDMRHRNITSYRKYREVISQEERKARLVKRQEKWIRDHAIDRIYKLEVKIYHKHYNTKKEMQSWSTNELINKRRRYINKLLEKRNKIQKETRTAEILTKIRESQKREWLKTNKLLGDNK
jgi:hypothetical protein